MATKTGFLDLPYELRDRVYREVGYDIFINNPHHAAAMKRPSAVDLRKGTLKKGFYNDEIFQSASAIIAANRQIHSEFYPILKQYIEIAPDLTVHVLDFNFGPFLKWMTSWSPQECARYRIGRECAIQVLFDFGRFPSLKMTLLKEWLAVVTHLHLDVSCAVVMQYPRHPWWVGHGFQYPTWVKKYCGFVKTSEKLITSYLSDELMVSQLQNDIDYHGKGKVRQWYRRYWDGVYDALREPVVTYEQFDPGNDRMISESYYNVIENHIEPARWFETANAASEDTGSDTSDSE